MFVFGFMIRFPSCDGKRRKLAIFFGADESVLGLQPLRWRAWPEAAIEINAKKRACKHRTCCRFDCVNKASAVDDVPALHEERSHSDPPNKVPEILNYLFLLKENLRLGVRYFRIAA